MSSIRTVPSSSSTSSMLPSGAEIGKRNSVGAGASLMMVSARAI
ncbi:hypothetical protein ACFPOI_28475 [Nonomuraea angiospora]|uniref:Uncharacterized protein n=1 Tax=Nonomuraea angiospora TaxID=46172 RepID=A0ABR9LUL2_9ACTN|nr:hypothetical protein [Nonomuraea angiospora]MBE1584005.1 hypothetical protein [Nonomuraea angiospora]